MRNTLLAAILVLLLGCESPNNAKQTLDAGYKSLDAREFDEAMARADQQLQESPSGTGAAEALYLKGRALEQKTASSPQEGRQQMMDARDAYREALGMHPGPRLEARLHAGIANASYFTDDYTTAQTEWTTAYPGFEDAAVKSFMLYRVGLCQQRLGQFAQADQTFAQVEQQYPGTDAAKRARDHTGFKSFTVQLGTYASSGTADAEISKLRKQGVIPGKSVNASGNTVISLPPVSNYSQAMDLKNRFVATYPNAMVLP
jgi:tetratricopeptide (TPR) repeat protein